MQNKINLEKAAFIMDIRGGAFFRDLERELDQMKEKGIEFKILFLEATDEVLVRRYKETRRIHPLSDGRTDIEAIREEKRMLSSLRKNADFIINTTGLKPMELQNKLQAMLMPDSDAENAFRITIMSFGYKHGMPPDADMVFDVRFIPNPFYLKSMRELTGNNQKVRDYVMNFEESRHFVKEMTEMIQYLIPYYMKQGKRSLAIAFGCTGGQHRSVSMVNEFADILENEERHVTRVHRDVTKR